MAGPCSASTQARFKDLSAGVENREWLSQKRIIKVGVMEEHRAEGCLDAREYDPGLTLAGSQLNSERDRWP